MYVLTPSASFGTVSVPDISSSIRLNELVSGSQHLYNQTYFLSQSMVGWSKVDPNSALLSNPTWHSDYDLYVSGSAILGKTNSIFYVPNTGSISLWNAGTKSRHKNLAFNFSQITAVNKWDVVNNPTGIPAIRASTATNDSIFVSLDEIVNHGETLTSADVSMIVQDAHGGGLPANQPLLTIEKVSYPGTSLATSTTVQAYQMTASSAAVYYNGGNVQHLTFNVTPNHVVDKDVYSYRLKIVDEYGLNSAAGNAYYYIKLSSVLDKLKPF